MKQKKSQVAKEVASAFPETTQASLRRIEHREWWLWGTAVAVTLLLTLGLASFLLPITHAHEDMFTLFTLQQAVRGLVGLVLLFDLYTVFQQLQIHRMRRKLVEREELFRLITENAADMIAVVDMEGHRLFNSLAYQKILGYSPEELKRSSSFEQIHPEDREKVKEAAEEARRTGEGCNLEYRMYHKDGSLRVLESTSSVIRNAKGIPEKLVVVNRDVTQRKETLEALRRSEASFRSVVEDAPYGIYRAGVSGEFLRVNPALQTMLGYESQEELLRASLSTNIFRDPREYEALMNQFLRVGDFKNVEVAWKKKDGTPITVHCSGRPVKNEDGAVAYLEVFAEDVTERRVLERQLHMAAKMEAIGRLSGGIAHDFNNLLGVIIGYSQVLKTGLGSGNPLYEHAEEVEKAGRRAASLTRQLLAFSRQQVLEPTILDLNALVSDAEKMLHRLIGEDVVLTTVLDEGLDRVKADPGQIEQIIMNLVVNSRDAMPQGGKVTIETSNFEMDKTYVRDHAGSKAGRYVVLAVTDTGTGMDAETLAHIFEPFFTTKERGKGTGLGLATVYGVVKQSGGYIWVDSEPGKGAAFRVYLPRIEESVDAPVASAGPAQTSRGSETILLVEDAEPLRKLACKFLENSGYRVLTAADGEEAIQTAARERQPIHLLLTDVVMPGMNGRVLASQLGPRHPGMGVLYMSGYTDSFIAGHGVLEAGTHLLHKPFSEETLTRKVREVLDGSAPEAPVAAPVAAGSLARKS
jgi:two-component system cell cycle sensor histidine kinase/response regulator CckA